tara:strand:+ start:1640 stop:1921 length:282 start_codon:yes stop_codon:yes gene_type:complete
MYHKLCKKIESNAVTTSINSRITTKCMEEINIHNIIEYQLWNPIYRQMEFDNIFTITWHQVYSSAWEHVTPNVYNKVWITLKNPTTKDNSKAR